MGRGRPRPLRPLKLLIDTHVYVWWVTDHGRLSPSARRAIEADESEILLSAVVPWELAIKVQLGKWPEGEGVLADMEDALISERLQPLPITHAHGSRAGRLASDHRDPFDRVLAAQAQIESACVVTADRAFKTLGVEIIW